MEDLIIFLDVLDIALKNNDLAMCQRINKTIRIIVKKHIFQKCILDNLILNEIEKLKIKNG